MLKEKPLFNRAQEVLFRLPLAVLAENERREISFANQFFCDLFEIPATPQQLSGMDCSNLAEQSKNYFTDESKFLAFIKEAIDFQQPISDIHLQLKNGAHLAASYVPYFKEEVFAGHIWTYQDITLRKEAELELERQKTFAAEILDSLPADIAIFDQDHKYLYTNYTAIKNPEIRDWIRGKDDFEYCEYRNRDTEMAHVRRAKFLEALSAGHQIEWEDQIPTSEGGTDYVLRKFNPHFDEHEQLRFMVGYGVNISEIKKKTEELRLSEIKYKTVVNHLQEIIFKCDLEGVIEFLNPAWEKITGYTVEYAMGKKLTHFIDPKFHAEIEQRIADLANNKSQELFTLLKITSKTKNSIYLEAYASKISMEDGQFSLWGAFTDVTEKQKVKNELLKTIQKERELNELKSRFVNMVSHEIRTPIAGILSSVELLELIHQGDLGQVISKSQKHFGRIKSQIKRVTELMNDVLLLGKIEAGKVACNPENVDILKIIKEIIEHHFNRNEIKRKINIEIAGTPRPFRLDGGLFKHIIINLLSNAVKYSADRPDPIVKIYFNAKDMSLEVIDFGIGIPAADQKNLFSAFVRASNTKNTEGTGLGLVVVKHFVGMHNGKITFKSTENMGTTFKLTFIG
ncbi:MAG: ATP-binding protein [Sphingobacteriaceae bacterium]